MSNIFSLKNKVSVVTGSSSGLGVQMAHALASQGSDLVLLARRKEKLDKVAQDIKDKFKVEVLTVDCDVIKLDQIKQAVKQTIEKFGKVDVLINNAGVGGMGEADKMSQEDWQKTIDVNLTGVFLCAQQFGQEMIKQEYGKIINTASIFGAVGNLAFPVAAYHASKGAVVNLTRALAAEWAKYNITVNAIGPGFFESEMTASIEDNPEADAFIKGSNPMHRWGRAGELDGAVLLLASDASSFITGQTLYVDGGWTVV